MRTQHGSMMESTGTQPTDLAHAQLRLAQAALPDAAHPRRAPLPLVPAARAMALQQAAGHLATGQASQWLKIATALPALALDAEAARQGYALAGAVAQQWLSLQAQWLDGLTELAQQMGQVRKVNTVSKFVDQEFDLAQQVFTLLSAQATAATRLAENLQLDLAWWLTQRADVAKAT